MAEFNITANDLERMMRMAYLESGSIPVQDRVRDFQQVLGSMLTRGQLFANGMAGEGYGKLRSDQKGNTGYDRTPVQLSLAAGSAYEPLGKFGGDLSKLPDVPQIYRELAAEYFGSVLKNPDTVDLHTDYGNPIVVKDRQGGNWQSHWLYGVSQNPDMVNGAGSVNQHAHGTMTGIELPKSFNPGFNGGAQEWINVNQSRDGLKSPEAVQAMLDWAATPDISIGTAGTDGFGDMSNIGDVFGLGKGGIGANGSVNTGLSTAMGYGAPGSGPGDALGAGNGAFFDGVTDPRVAGSIYINPNTFAGRFAVGDALGAGNGNIGDSGRPVETGDPYSFSALTPGRAVRDAYENVLGRTATQSELDGWKGAIHPGGLTLGQALDQIAASPEAVTRATFTGIDPRTYGVIDAYASQLNRLPDQQGLTGWMQQLSQGASLDSVLNRISNSPEAQRADLSNFYQTALKRQADPSGLQYALDQLAGGRSLQAVETSILSSPEAQARGITPDQFASLLTPSYLSPALNTRTQAGTQGPGAATGTINTGTDAGTIGAPGISPIINDLYNAILQRAPDAQGAQAYQGQLAAGVPADLIQAQILNSGEAAQTLGPDRLASMLNDYQTAHGRSADTAATLAPLASEYSQTLGRGIDAPTLQTWGQQIQSGTPTSIMEAQLLAAPEVQQARNGSLDSLTSQYQAKYGLLPSEVNTLSPLASQFQQALQRGVDTPTLQAWDAQLDAGTPLSILQAQLFGAPEVQARGSDALAPLINNYQTQYGMAPQEVAALAPLASQFSQLLGRPADTPTLQAWDAQIDAGTSMPTLQAQLLQAPEVTARTGGQGDLYNAFQGQNGRSASDYLAGLSNPNGFTGINTSGSVGNGTFSGTFDPTQYLAANRDVQAAGMDPLTHYLTYGYNEGRALDTAGDRINKGFDASAYLNANQDVKAAGLDPLYQYITSGASEGRAMPTGGNPYSFSGINVGQGVGAGTFSGSFDPSQYLAANRDVAASGMDPLRHYLTYGFAEGRAIDTAGDKINQGFDPKAYLAQNQDVAASKMDPLAHYLEFGAHEGRALPTGINPYSFSNFNVGGYQIPNGSGSGAVGSLSVNNASGAANGLGGSGGAGGSAFGYSDSGGNPQVATFNPQQSELSYLQGQVNQTNQMIAAGQQETANNPNAANGALANIGFGIQTAINPTAGLGAGIQNFGSNAAIGTYSLPAVTPLPTIPVLPGGLRGTAAIGGYLGGNGFGGAGGFF